MIGWVSGDGRATLNAMVNPTPTRPSVISTGDWGANGTRVTRRSRVAPQTKAIVSPTTVMPNRSNASRIASADRECGTRSCR